MRALAERQLADLGLPQLTISDPIKALLDEVGGGNVVRVFKSEAVSVRGRQIHRPIIEIPSLETQAMLPALFAHDTLRHIAGKKPIYGGEFKRLFGQEFHDAGFNLRVNAGIDFTYNQLSGTSVAVADTLALSNNTNTPAATDTNAATHPWDTAQATAVAGSSTTGEWTAFGLTRKVATTNTHTAAATTYTLAATWTGATSATVGTRMVGLFGGAGKASQGTGGTNILCLSNTFTNADLQVADTLTVTWTITI